MGIDIRFPIGLMFTIFGLVLTIFGLVTNSNAEMYKRSLEININLWTGLVTLIFGGLMLFFALRARKNRKK
ncbi:hypothetical protein ES705_17323 [subsurface metagenome]